MNFYKTISKLGLCITLVGCGSASCMVIDSTDNLPKVRTLQIEQKQAHIKIDKNVETIFNQHLKKVLYAEHSKFKPGQELKLCYRFIGFNQGNRFGRYLVGGLGNFGEGRVNIEISYFDQNDKFLTKTFIEGHIGSGFLGGSINSALKRAAEEVAAFTTIHFGT